MAKKLMQARGRKPRNKAKAKKAKAKKNATARIQEPAAAQDNGAVASSPGETWHCTWQDNNDRPCGKVFHTWASFESHQNQAKHVCFKFLQLAPEIRNRVYEMVVGPPFSFEGEDDDYEDELMPHPGSLNLHLLTTCKQVYQESFRFLYREITLEISGFAWSALRKTGPVTRLAREARRQQEVAMSRGYFPDLNFMVRAAKWVKRWVIAIDMKQYEGDLLYPDVIAPIHVIAAFSTRLDRRAPGKLPHNMLRMVAFARLWEQMQEQGCPPASIHVRLYNSASRGAKVSIPHDVFLESHVMETLHPLRTVRGVKNITFSSDLAEVVGDKCLDFLKDVMKIKTAIVSVHKSTKIVRDLKNFIYSFNPHQEQRYEPVLQWINALYVPHGALENLKLLDTMVNEKQCWAIIFPIYWRIYSACKTRMTAVYEALGVMRCGRYRRNDDLVRVYNAFIDGHFLLRHFPILSPGPALTEFCKWRSQHCPKLYEWAGELGKVIQAPVGSSRHTRLFNEMRASMRAQGNIVTFRNYQWVRKDYNNLFLNGISKDEDGDEIVGSGSGECDNEKGAPKLTDVEQSLDLMHKL